MLQDPDRPIKQRVKPKERTSQLLAIHLFDEYCLIPNDPTNINHSNLGPTRVDWTSRELQALPGPLKSFGWVHGFSPSSSCKAPNWNGVNRSNETTQIGGNHSIQFNETTQIGSILAPYWFHIGRFGGKTCLITVPAVYLGPFGIFSCAWPQDIKLRWLAVLPVRRSRLAVSYYSGWMATTI